MLNFPRKAFLTALNLGVFLILLGAAGVVRPFDAASLLAFRSRTPAAPSTVSHPQPAARNVNPAAKTTPSVSPEQQNAYDQLADPSGALNTFYKALARTEAGQGVTRILHYGDSPVTADSITADARSLFQERFGDAGHGFILIAKPWAWYGHRGVDVRGTGWKIEPASQSRAKDGFHGLGGVSFTGRAGASSHFKLATGHARVEVHFLRQPDGGVFAVFAGDRELGRTSTEGDSKKPDWAAFALQPDEREVRLVVESGSVRLFGASFEKDGSGTIYNSLGLNGGQVQAVVRYFEPGQWTEQLQHQHPDLVVVNYGTNESVYPDYIEHYYAGELREVIRRVKNALPGTSVLIMSPMDRGQRGSDGQIHTAPALPKLVEIQHRMAGETGCAFFDTFQAMGGEGTMARWYEQQPRLVSADFMHPLPAGARKVGVLLFDALMSGYQTYQAGTSKTPAANDAPARLPK